MSSQLLSTLSVVFGSHPWYWHLQNGGAFVAGLYLHQGPLPESIIMVMSNHVSVGMEPKSSARAKSALGHWAISLSHQPVFLYTAETPVQEWHHPQQSLIEKMHDKLVYRPVPWGYLLS